MKLRHKLSLPKISSKTPLAWCQLSHKKVRLAVATTGIAFANILMFTQLGLLSVLTKGGETSEDTVGESNQKEIQM